MPINPERRVQHRIVVHEGEGVGNANAHCEARQLGDRSAILGGVDLAKVGHDLAAPPAQNCAPPSRTDAAELPFLTPMSMIEPRTPIVIVGVLIE